MKPNSYSSEQIEKIRIAGQLVAKTLDYITEFVKPGITTHEIDELCDIFIRKNKGLPACLGYQNFPKSICTSINDVVCHGIPNKKTKLKEGDIVNIDIVVKKDGFFADASRMYKVGRISPENEKLIEVVKEATFKGIERACAGNRLGDIGHAIQAFVEGHGFSVVKDYCGHGIGRSMHEFPNILHFGTPNNGLEIVKGMVFTIEPMINAGKDKVYLSNDNWTVKTLDKSMSAQFEHTIAINQDGKPEILTKYEL